MDALTGLLLLALAGETWTLWRVWMRALEAEHACEELLAELLDRDEVARMTYPTPTSPSTSIASS